MRDAYRTLEGKMKEREPGIDVRIILTGILNKQDGRMGGY
jgi:hypothetical protein